MKHGLCSQVDPELFFPEAGSNMTKRAKSVCSSCPVMDRCMSYALEHPGIAGVWGGTTERDRDEIRRKRRAAA
jgi:WhiB family redox-sensing transcriptional regulator